MTSTEDWKLETGVLRELYAAINRHDIAAAVALMDPDVVRVEFEGSPSGGTYRGHRELRDHLAKGRSTWAEGACEPESFVTSGDRIVVRVHVRVRLKNETEWIDARIADGFRFRGGKVIEMRSFAKEEEGLAWAGISSKPA